MAIQPVKPRAIIFDIYGTLLEVGPPPPDAEARWQYLVRENLRLATVPSRIEFAVACNRVIARHHQLAKSRGILWPEVHWPSIVSEVLPQLLNLPPEARQDFLYRQIQTGHTIRMTPDTASFLRSLQHRSIPLGIASNAQEYTLRELSEALSVHQLDPGLFHPDLTFWSCRSGFSKPDPHVFRILEARLCALGINPAETLMVGDSLENDIQPARAASWQTWRIGPQGDGDWAALHRQLMQSPHAIRPPSLAPG